MAPPLAFGFRGWKVRGLHPQGRVGRSLPGSTESLWRHGLSKTPLTPPLVEGTYISQDPCGPWGAAAAWRWVVGGSPAALEAHTAAVTQVYPCPALLSISLAHHNLWHVTSSLSPALWEGLCNWYSASLILFWGHPLWHGDRKKLVSDLALHAHRSSIFRTFTRTRRGSI